MICCLTVPPGRRKHRSGPQQRRCHTPYWRSPLWWKPGLVNQATSQQWGRTRSCVSLIEKMMIILGAWPGLLYLEANLDMEWCFDHQVCSKLFAGCLPRAEALACQDAIAQATHVVFLGDEVPQHEDGDATSGGRYGGVHRDLSRQGTGRGVVHAQGAARVEAIPAEPQRKGAQPQNLGAGTTHGLSVLQTSKLAAGSDFSAPCTPCTCFLKSSTCQFLDGGTILSLPEENKGRVLTNNWTKCHSTGFVWKYAWNRLVNHHVSSAKNMLCLSIFGGVPNFIDTTNWGIKLIQGTPQRAGCGLRTLRGSRSAPCVASGWWFPSAPRRHRSGGRCLKGTDFGKDTAPWKCKKKSGCIDIRVRQICICDNICCYCFVVIIIFYHYYLMYRYIYIYVCVLFLCVISVCVCYDMYNMYIYICRCLIIIFLTYVWIEHSCIPTTGLSGSKSDREWKKV